MSETKTFVVPDYCRNDNDDFAKMALLNNGGINGWGNNPFFYLIWMWMMRYMNGDACQGNPQITALQTAMQDNHNSDLLMSAIRGNESAVREFSATTGLNFSAVQNAICGVKSAINEVGAQLGFSSERVINSVQAGDCAVIQAIKDAGCSINQNIIKMGYDNQLSNERQTTTINQGIYGLNTALDRNACAIEYNTQKQTCTLQNAIKDTSAASTNAIIAKLDAIEDSRKDREISTLTAQLAQAQARAERQAELAPIIAQVNDIRRNQPATTTIEYPQLTAIPSTAFLGSLPINTGIWG